MQKKSSELSYMYILNNHGMCCEFGVPSEYSDHLLSEFQT